MGKTIGKLIAETLSGNKLAEGELYVIYKKKINLLLINKYGNREDHSDDVSEILMKIFQNLNKFDDKKSKFDTWITMIAKNYMIDKSRKKKPTYVSFTSNTFNSDDSTYDSSINNSYNGTFTNLNTLNILEPACDTVSPHDVLEISDQLKHISNKIGMDNYLMLKMKYSDGYSYDEIAKEFQSDSGIISNKLNYIRKKIKNGEEY